MINIGYVTKGEISHLKDVGAVFCPALAAHLLSQVAFRPNMNLLKRHAMSRDPDMEDVLLALFHITGGDFLHESVSCVRDIPNYLETGNPIICTLKDVDVGTVLYLSPFGAAPELLDGDRRISIVITSFADGYYYGYVPQRDTLVSLHADLLARNYTSVIRTYLKGMGCDDSLDVPTVSSGCVSDDECSPTTPPCLSADDDSIFRPRGLLHPITQLSMFARPFYM
jgi:hypothetical protein